MSTLRAQSKRKVVVKEDNTWVTRQLRLVKVGLSIVEVAAADIVHSLVLEQKGDIDGDGETSLALLP